MSAHGRRIVLGAWLALVAAGNATGQAGAGAFGGGAHGQYGQYGSGRIGKDPSIGQDKPLDAGQDGKPAGPDWIMQPTYRDRIFKQDGNGNPYLNELNKKVFPPDRVGGRLPPTPGTAGDDPRAAAVLKAAQLKKYTIDDPAGVTKPRGVPRAWGLAPPNFKRPAGSCPQCQEVDPEPAGTILERDYKLPPPKGSSHIAALGLGSQDTAACSGAVKGLRALDGTGFNRVDDTGFQQQCLGTGADGAATTLDSESKPAVAACFRLYAQFDETCLETATSKHDEALLQQAGILVRVVPGLPMKILCSAWRVSASSVLSARHCLARSQLLAPGQTAVVPGALTFLPYAQDGAVKLDPGRRRIGYVVSGEIGKDGTVQDLTYPTVRPSIEQDLVLLSVQATDGPGVGATMTTRPQVAIPVQSRQGNYLTVIGFQEFVYRAYLLSARLKNEVLPTDESLVASGEWRKFVRVHRSAICRSLISDRGSLRHFCQTFGRTSGAPIFDFDSTPGSKPLTYLVGVQSRGLAAVENVRANNEAVALHQGVHPHLEKTLGMTRP